MAAERHGGQRRWAWDLGVPYISYDQPDWAEHRIRAELEKFLAGKSVWPGREEFERAGLLDLREAARTTRGWAAGPRDGSRVASPRAECRPWTYEMMRTALSEFAGDRGDWPTRAELQDAGLRPLYEAIRYAGVRAELLI